MGIIVNNVTPGHKSMGDEMIIRNKTPHLLRILLIADQSGGQ
jgi:hypothetical protein